MKKLLFILFFLIISSISKAQSSYQVTLDSIVNAVLTPYGQSMFAQGGGTSVFTDLSGSSVFTDGYGRSYQKLNLQYTSVQSISVDTLPTGGTVEIPPRSAVMYAFENSPILPKATALDFSGLQSIDALFLLGTVPANIPIQTFANTQTDHNITCRAANGCIVFIVNF